MLALSAAERLFLQTQTTVAMNKYLLFWDIIGLWPTHFFLADIHYPALRVYEESVAIAAAHGRPPRFLLDRQFRLRYSENTFRRLLNRRFAREQLHRYGFTPNPAARPAEATYFRRTHGWDSPERWATSLREKLYFYRGSLSVLLNLLTILNLGKHIKLLGVDLGSPGSFYDDRLAERPYLMDDYLRLQQSGAVQQHMTAAEFKGMPGIQAKWPFIQRSVEAAGFRLSCCNPESLLVKEGLCPYAPVIE